MYAVIEIDTKGNYRGTIEKANVLVTAFGTDLNYIENQAAKGTELKIKKEPDSRGIDPSNRRYDIDESNSETGDVPSPDANIQQNGNGVNTLAIRAVSNPKVSQIYNWGIKNDTSLGGVGHTPFGSNSNGTSSDVSKANIPQNGNGVNTLDAENSAAKAQQNSENAAQTQQRKPGTVSAEQKTLLQTDVLLSAFADENGIVPVRLTVKEYKDKDNSLYALITLEKIETEIKDRGESFATTPTPYPVSEMSIPEIVSKIKPTDGNILKYLPDKLLNAEQLEGKQAKR